MNLNLWQWIFGDDRPRGGELTAQDAVASGHLALARESLRELLDDRRLPEGVRESLADDYGQVQALLDKLEHGHVHIAAFGRVSTGKSSLLNALVGRELFAVSALHGATRSSAIAELDERAEGGVFVIDTPGIDEAGGEAREALAHEVAARADLVLFVVDSDLTSSELDALGLLAGLGRPVVLVLNKVDRYTDAERDALLAGLKSRAAGLVEARHVVAAAADPRPVTVIELGDDGVERTSERAQAADILALKTVLWEILEREGKTLAALNATLFAADLSDKVGERILTARREIAQQVVRTYCLAKGAAVALNPVPVADLFAAAAIDVGMVAHLSRVYDLPIAKREAGSLVRVIMTEAAALTGTVWAVHLISSALKVGTGGLSTFVTAGAQGAIAWYGTYVVGQVAERYLAAGKSWGDGGPKQVVREILDSLDRDSILREAREEIQARLRGG